MGTNPEQDHRDRIARYEGPAGYDADEAWREGQSSARMLGCVLMIVSALVLVGIGIAIWLLVESWLSK